MSVSHTRFARTICLIVLLCAIGCAKRRQREQAVFARPDNEHVLAIVVDLSGSFAGLMAEDGKAYEFVLDVIDHYFRNRIGRDDKLIIAQISASDPLLWEGRPLDLRREFRSAADFRDFLLAEADPRASYVYDGMHATLEYLMSDPAVHAGRTQSALLVLSDLVDTGPDPGDRARRLLHSLTDYGACGGIVGLYYVATPRQAKWRKALRDAGLREYRVESEIVGKPQLPNFEQ